MRILLIGPSLFVPWMGYTRQALERLGHTVRTIHYTSIGIDRLTLSGRRIAASVPMLDKGLERLRNRWLRRRDARILAAASEFKPELTLVHRGESLAPELLKELKRRTGRPLVAWWGDDPFEYGSGHLLPLYDTVFMFDRSYLPRLKEIGVHRAEFLPAAVDPSVYHPRQLSAKEQSRYGCDLALIGWYYPYRGEMVHQLREMNLKVWGRGWLSAEARQTLNGASRKILIEDRFVSGPDACKIYNAAKIGLNIHSHQTHDGGLNMRVFELAASGCFQLTDAVSGMEEMLEPGKEVAVYRSTEEARSLADHFLKHPEERAAIAARARERVLKQHTYDHRMRSLLEMAG